MHVLLRVLHLLCLYPPSTMFSRTLVLLLYTSFITLEKKEKEEKNNNPNVYDCTTMCIVDVYMALEN